MPIATAVAWFHDCAGGEFVFYPDGPDAPPVVHEVRYNTALLLDSDSVFHGIDRMAETSGPIAPLRPGMTLRFEGNGRWSVLSGDERLASYDWKDLRLSISWKAYCFEGEAERRSWAKHSDDLSLDFILDRLVADLRAGGRLGRERPGNRELARMLIDEYIHFPAPAPADT